MRNSGKFFAAAAVMTFVLGSNALPSMATEIPAAVQIGQCNGATALIAPTDPGMGFAGGNQCAVLVNAGAGESGVAMIPNYNGIENPYKYWQNGTMTFRDDGRARNSVSVNVCFGGFRKSKTLGKMHITSLGDGWSQAHFNTRDDFGATKLVLTKFTVTLNNARGNIAIGNTVLHVYPGDVIIPSNIDSPVQGCGVVNTCGPD